VVLAVLPGTARRSHRLGGTVLIGKLGFDKLALRNSFSHGRSICPVIRSGSCGVFDGGHVIVRLSGSRS
jgi:hypothetical protein